MIAIISILSSLLLPAVFRAYLRAREFDEEMSGPAIMESIRNKCRDYCAGHPRFVFTNKPDFMEKCAFMSKGNEWMRSSKSDLVPFSYLDATNKTVLTFRYGRKQREFRWYTCGDLSLPSE